MKALMVTGAGRIGWIRSIAALFAILVLSACAKATGPTFRPVELSQQESVVYFFRPAAHIGALAGFMLVVDGREIAELKNDGYFPLRTSPGPHVVSIQPKPGAFSAKYFPHDPLEVTVLPGREHFVRVSFEMSAPGALLEMPRFLPVTIREVPRGEALPMIVTLRLSGTEQAGSP